MTTPEVGAGILRLLMTVTIVGLVYSLAAIAVRERFGRRSLPGGAGAAALVLSVIGSFNMWSAKTAAGVPGGLTLSQFLFVAIAVSMPIAGATLLVWRQKEAPQGAQWIYQSLAAVAAFWAAIVVAALPVIILDLARFFGG